MPKVDVDLVTNQFESPESPWTYEQRLVENLFRQPAVRLTAVMLGIHPHTELPYWDFKADARRHAIRCVQSGKDERNDIVEDYNKKLWTPSMETVLGGNEYDALMRELIDGLPHGPSRVPYADVIKRRYGFEGATRDPKNLSKEFELTVGRIKNLERKALDVLHHPSRSDRVKSYLEEKRRLFVGRFYSE